MVFDQKWNNHGMRTRYAQFKAQPVGEDTRQGHINDIPGPDDVVKPGHDRRGADS